MESKVIREGNANKASLNYLDVTPVILTVNSGCSFSKPFIIIVSREHLLGREKFTEAIRRF
jgi:hypothetical protein